MPTHESSSGDPAPKSGSSRPSLMGTGAAGDSRTASILQALERGDAPSAPAASASTAPRHLAWKIAGFGLLLAAGLVWTLRPGDAPPPAGDSAVIAAIRVAKAPAPVEMAPSAAEAAAASAAAAEAPVVARIENLPPAAAESRPAEPAASAAVMAAAPAPVDAPAASQAAAVAKADTASDAAPPVPKPPHKPRHAEVATAASKTHATVAPAHKPQTMVAATSATVTAPRPASGALRRDADVDIVTALMSHIEGRTPAAAARTAAPAKAQASTTVTPADAASPVRLPDNIADLVASCRGATGTDEALACRWRICKGYWGKADACPVRDRKAAARAARAARELQARGDS